MTNASPTLSTILGDIDKNLYLTLKNSIYPGAKDESIAMVVAYCRAAKLDPLQKPFHIVGIWVKDKENPKGGDNRDVVMPGITLYRIQASRAHCAGISEPEFGPDITKKIGTLEITYPLWAKVIVKKIVNGVIVEFAAKEFWIENYASKSNADPTPNAMWAKRPYAQLAKCTEAQALRRGFPELCSVPTAEEMEGKIIDQDYMEQMEQMMEKQKENATKGVSALKARIGITSQKSETVIPQKIKQAKPVQVPLSELEPTEPPAEMHQAELDEGGEPANPGDVVLVKAKIDFEQRDLAKQIGFKWDTVNKRWLKTMTLQEAEMLPFNYEIVLENE
jgi:phage recombination protein Bet